jgi:hypothetical protein
MLITEHGFAAEAATIAAGWVWHVHALRTATEYQRITVRWLVGTSYFGITQLTDLAQ